MNDNNFKKVEAAVLINSTFEELRRDLEAFSNGVKKPLTKVNIELNEEALKSMSEEYNLPEDKVERLLNSIVLLD